MKFRKTKDDLGLVDIPSDKLWGAYTERAFEASNVGIEKMPVELIYAFVLLKKAAAEANCSYKKITEQKKKSILKAADEILHSKFDDHFPLRVWQSGSGKETHININEVLQALSQKKMKKATVDLFDEISLSQSSHDTFSSAMHIATVTKIIHDLLPKLNLLHMGFVGKAEEFKGIQKLGRVHLMESHRLTLGEEFSAYCVQLEKGILLLQQTTIELYNLPIGGSYIGMGQKAPKKYGQKVVKVLQGYTKIPFSVAPNQLALIASHDIFLGVSSAIKQIVLALNKIASDLALMASGPHFGFGEILLPVRTRSGKNDPSILEVVGQVCAQILGNDTTVSFASSSSCLELNTFKPVIIYNLIQSIQLLGDVAISFANECIIGIEPNLEKLATVSQSPLIISSILNQELGSAGVARVYQFAKKEKLSIKNACIKLGLMSAKKFNSLTK